MSCKYCDGNVDNENIIHENVGNKNAGNKGELFVFIENGNMYSECYIGHLSMAGDIEIKYCPVCGRQIKAINLEEGLKRTITLKGNYSKNLEYSSLHNNNVNHPKHYNQGKYEVIDVIEDWQCNFALGNAIKYIARAEHKGKYVEDLKKAIFYLQREIDNHDNK